MIVIGIGRWVPNTNCVGNTVLVTSYCQRFRELQVYEIHIIYIYACRGIMFLSIEHHERHNCCCTRFNQLQLITVQ